ncbi:GNAT family N-acetyltransferase [Nonomuraea sp. NPDC050643]|uniref:GNAT family N-acetyltransferase n=1 Tax=Nonomuraea sp. NPDC050643 TaxID=3155660 RepID=UPI0033DCA338
MSHIYGILAGAVTWLRDIKRTDQWSTDERGRKKRIRKGVRSGHTWIAWHGDTPVATITLDTEAPKIWTEQEKTSRSAGSALYVHRLMVKRDPAYQGQKIGAELLTWAGSTAARRRRDYIRLDVWTFNEELHRYYKSLGFTGLGNFEHLYPGYSASALFERPAKVAETPRLNVEKRRGPRALRIWRPRLRSRPAFGLIEFVWPTASRVFSKGFRER